MDMQGGSDVAEAAMLCRRALVQHPCQSSCASLDEDPTHREIEMIDCILGDRNCDAVFLPARAVWPLSSQTCGQRAALGFAQDFRASSR